MRLQGWEQRLADYLRDCHSGAIILSRYDCARFAALWVELATGEPVTHPFLKSGVDRKDSLDLLSKTSIEACVSDVLPNMVSILRAMRGDIVLRRQDGLAALGICDGDNSHFLHDTKGLVPLMTSQCDVAWSVQ